MTLLRESANLRVFHNVLKASVCVAFSNEKPAKVCECEVPPRRVKKMVTQGHVCSYENSEHSDKMFRGWPPGAFIG